MDAYFEFERPITSLEKRIAELKEMSVREKMDFSTEIQALERKLKSLIHEVYSNLSPWQRVMLSRHPNRPYTEDYIVQLISDFQEFHGDRKFHDDPAIITGFGNFNGKPVAIIGQQKGRGTKEKMRRNFGMVKPEGYRKAIRIMEMASRFEIPIFTFVDTPGAFPGIDAEERGQSEAIADSIMRMFDLRVPVISVVIGEGGSGGALAIAVANRVLMQEFSTYSVISPESCASILWSDSSQAERAAQVLKMSAPEVKQLGVINDIIREPLGGAHRNHQEAARFLSASLEKQLNDLESKSADELIENRRLRFRKIGQDFMVQSKLNS